MCRLGNRRSALTRYDAGELRIVLINEKVRLPTVCLHLFASLTKRKDLLTIIALGLRDSVKWFGWVSLS